MKKTLSIVAPVFNEAGFVRDLITELTAVASYYLANQPGSNLIPYGETRNVDYISFPDLKSQAVLCPWQLPLLQGSADLFVNFISFQEMEPHVVRDYLYHADRLNCGFVLLRNLREGKQRRSERVTYGVETPTVGNDYDRFLPNYRLVATNVIPFGFRTIDGFNSELRLYERRG